MTKAKAIQKIDFDTETVDLIKRTVAVGATDSELKLFLYQAKRTGLDPLTRQIYFIKMGNRPVMMSSIDGFRVVANRSGDYAGQDEPEYTYSPEYPGRPDCAKVRVYKWHKDQRYLAAVGVAFWSEYNVPGSQAWQKMPRVMLAKVAEALALRKAFPQDLSGIYEESEMDQAKRTADAQSATPPAPQTAGKSTPASPAQQKMIFGLAKQLGHEPEKAKEIMKTHFKLESFNDLTKAQASIAIENLQNKLAKMHGGTNGNTPEEEVVDPDEVDAGIKAQEAEKAKEDEDPEWITGKTKTEPTAEEGEVVDEPKS